MEIIVCIKSTPDTETVVRPLGKDIDHSGVSFIVNPFDEYALEEAVRITEKDGGSVITLCLGDAGAEEILRKTIAAGAKKGVLLLSHGEIRDPFQTALALAAEIKHRSYDLLFFGKESVDNNNASVGPLVAAMLGLPCVTDVVKVEVKGGKVLAHRESDNDIEVIEAGLPCVLTAQKGLNEPRFCSLKSIMGAKDAEVEIIAPFMIPQMCGLDEMQLPPERPPGRIIGKGTEAVPELLRLLDREVNVL